MRRIVLSAATAVLLAGCAGSGRFASPPALPDDRADIPMPNERSYNTYRDLFDKQITVQVRQSFDLSRQLRNLAGARKEAYNADALDEVRDSSWFVNRNARRRLSLDEIARGPDTGPGPDRGGPWTVVSAKAQGVTPGFTIEDGRGDRYMVKFDPPGWPELATGAEMISTKLLHAAGYHVPENHLVVFSPDSLVLGEGVRFRDDFGRKRTMTEADLAALLGRVERRADGRIRAIASRHVPGVPRGPFAFHGTRGDDPNDIVPHQHRRELRGLRVIAAWLNHVDTKSGNTLDAWVEVGGRRFLRHYLIDFGTTLGSAATRPAPAKTGHENQVDPHIILLNVLSLGARVPAWESLGPPASPATGRFDATLFEPEKFKFSIPNPAFENCTARDGFWGAKIVMSFTDEQIERAVAAARYTDPADAALVARVLRERRDRTGRFWYRRVEPLDRFRLERGDGGWLLYFDDLAVEAGFADAAGTRHRCEILVGGRTIDRREIGRGEGLSIPVNAVDGEEQVEVQIESIRGGEGPGRRVSVFVAPGERPLILGIRRES